MDTSLTIGRRSSPGIFNSLPDAVECKIKKVFDVAHLSYLLDDFLSVKSLFGKARSVKTHLDAI